MASTCLSVAKLISLFEKLTFQPIWVFACIPNFCFFASLLSFLGVTQSASHLPVYQPAVISSHPFFQNLNLWPIFSSFRFVDLPVWSICDCKQLPRHYLPSTFLYLLFYFCEISFISGSQGNAMWARGTALPVSVLISGNGNKIFHIWGCQQDFSGNVNKISHPWRCQQDFSSPEMPTRKSKVYTSAVM